MNRNAKPGIEEFLLTLAAFLMIVYSGWYVYWNAARPGSTSLPDMLLVAGLIGLALLTLTVGFRSSARAKSALLYLFYVGISVEVLLQGVAYLGLIPGLNYFHQSPYSRVYTTNECFSHSHMNSLGWYYPEFKLKEDGRRIVLIGDSFIQALQVQPDRNVGNVLEHLIGERNESPDRPAEVLSIGLGGVGPGTYFELLKYAIDYFKPEEVIIFICFCNDFRDSSYSIEKDGPDYDPVFGIYYYLDSNGQVKLHPTAAEAPGRLRKQLSANHRGFLYNLPAILRDNCLTLILLKHLYYKLKARNRPSDEIGNAFPLIGCQDFIFLRDEPQKAVDAFKIATALFEKCYRYARKRKVVLRFVTIPTFPAAFLDSHDWEDWGLEKGKYDFLLPENKLIQWAAEKDIPLLPMGRFIKGDSISLNEVKGLFCFGGRGHWTAKGHDYWAGAIHRTFFQK
jgi:hypothetical protein